MTEKRFQGNFQDKMLVSVKDTERNCNVNILQIIEIANNIIKENERLKKENHLLNKTIENIQEELSKYGNEWVEI